VLLQKCLKLDALKEKDIHLAHSSGGSRAWHQHLLGSNEGLMADGIKMARVHVEGIT
jgi:hypothetical protein